MADCQLWPKLGYGICNNLATWNELEHCLQKSIDNLSGEEVCSARPQSSCASWTKVSLALAVHIQMWNALWPNLQSSLSTMDAVQE
jgi:hypothetical protein